MSNITKIISRSFDVVNSIWNADKMILDNKCMPTTPNRVNLHYWDIAIEKKGKIPFNLGDNLAEIVVDYMLSKKNLSLDAQVHQTKHLYAVGSIINMGYQNATIWGSGFLDDISDNFRRCIAHRPLFRKLDVRAVRGPYSRQTMLTLGHQCPEVYGDPVLLMPKIYQPHSIEKKYDYVVIPHFSMEEFWRKKIPSDIIVSMITNDYKSVIDKICSAKRVISGSLHGIILSESYGVPTIFLRDRCSNRDFKYNDYYSSTNREKYIYACSIEEAINMKPMDLPNNLTTLQDGLINSFPYDLWEK